MKKQTLYALIILFVTTYHTIHAVTINGKELHEESYSQAIDCSKMNSVSFRIATNNINIESTTLETQDDISSCYDNLFQKALRWEIISYTNPAPLITSSYYMDIINAAFFVTKKGIELNSSDIKTNQVIFSVPENTKLDIKCDSFSPKKTFADAGLLRILSLNAESPIQSIIFTLDHSHELPHLIEGDINFNNPEKNQHITVTGVKNIECIFSSEK